MALSFSACGTDCWINQNRKTIQNVPIQDVHQYLINKLSIIRHWLIKLQGEDMDRDIQVWQLNLQKKERRS
jgi:hypothetical protein